MAVQVQNLAHAFRHETRALRPSAPLDDTMTGASSVFLNGDNHLLLAELQSRGNAVFSDLTCRNNDNDYFVPRKRARVGDEDVAPCMRLVMEKGNRHMRALLPSVPFTGDVRSSSGDHGSGAASTSGRPVAVSSQGLLSRFHLHGVEVDALVRIESERLRAGLEAARRRHVRAAVSALERAAAGRLRAAEADLARALLRGAELEEELRRVAVEGQAWRGVATRHEAAAAGLRASLDQLLQPLPCPGASDGDQAAAAKDAESCCFDRREDDGPSARACKVCGGAGACVLLLPCRHLCLCAGCEAAVEACPVCAATKNASLHVLLS